MWSGKTFSDTFLRNICTHFKADDTYRILVLGPRRPSAPLWEHSPAGIYTKVMVYSLSGTARGGDDRQR